MVSLLQRSVVVFGISAIYFQLGVSLVLPMTLVGYITVSENSVILSPNATLINDTSSFIAPHCVRNHDWIGEGIAEYDCRRLVNWFYDATIPRHDYVYEFVGPDAQSIVPDPVRTPEKYTNSKSA